MSTAFDAGRLGRTDVLTLQQVTSFMSNDMQVTGPDGQTVATVVTTGGFLRRADAAQKARWLPGLASGVVMVLTGSIVT